MLRALCCSPFTGHFNLQSHDKARVRMHFNLTQAFHCAWFSKASRSLTSGTSSLALRHNPRERSLTQGKCDLPRHTNWAICLALFYQIVLSFLSYLIFITGIRPGKCATSLTGPPIPIPLHILVRINEKKVKNGKDFLFDSEQRCQLDKQAVLQGQSSPALLILAWDV